MISVYKTCLALASRLRPNLPARSNRMLATDNEINDAKEQTGETGVFSTAEQMGLTDEEFAKFLNVKQASEDQARAKLLGEMMPRSSAKTRRLIRPKKKRFGPKLSAK